MCAKKSWCAMFEPARTSQRRLGEFTAKAVINASGRWSQLTQRESPDTDEVDRIKGPFQ